MNNRMPELVTDICSVINKIDALYDKSTLVINRNARYSLHSFLSRARDCLSHVSDEMLNFMDAEFKES